MKPWLQKAVVVLGTIALVYAMIYVDVVCRARYAYRQGEMYWNWTDHPEEYRKKVDADLAATQADLAEKFAHQKLTKEQYDRQLRLAGFTHDVTLGESTIKYAYVWYQTAVVLFSPPNSKWVTLSRQKMPLAKERWIAELKAKHIPFEDYMID